MLGWKGLNLKYNKQPMKNELRMELPLILHAKHSSVAGMYTVFASNVCNDIDVIVLFTSGPHLRHNYHGNKTLETMLSGSVEFVGHRLNRPVLLHLCVCRVLPINNATMWPYDEYFN